jgi:cytochrome c-type biogenesis protein CcmH
MRPELPRPAIRIAARALSLAVLAVVASAVAQEKSPLPPEVTAILGEPGGPKASLDADVLAILGQPEGARPRESTVGALAADIASKLRCPVCQGVSIADSPSGMATKMREQVRDLVAQGYGEEQVMSYFERSYGEFVRLEPPLRGLNVMLWILPGLVLLGGSWFVFRKARKPVAATTTSADPPPSAPVDPALARYLDRIRRDSGTS